MQTMKGLLHFIKGLVSKKRHGEQKMTKAYHSRTFKCAWSHKHPAGRAIALPLESTKFDDRKILLIELILNEKASYFFWSSSKAWAHLDSIGTLISGTKNKQFEGETSFEIGQDG